MGIYTAELHVPHVSLEEISGIDFTMISAQRYSFILLLIPPISPVGDRCQASVFSEIEKKLYYKIQKRFEAIRFEEVYMKLIFFEVACCTCILSNRCLRPQILIKKLLAHLNTKK